MNRFGNDSRCLEALKSFNTDTAAAMAAYRKAILVNERQLIVEKARKQLSSIESHE